MTTEEVGAYALLSTQSWSEEPPCSIPADDYVLAKWARLTSDRWSECRARVLAAFTIGADGRYHQKRLRSVFNLESQKSHLRHLAGSKGASARWNGKRIATASDCHCDRIPPPSESTYCGLDSNSLFRSNSLEPKTQLEEQVKEKKSFELPEWVPKDKWAEFEKMRKRMRKPLTDHAKELLVRDLDLLRNNAPRPYTPTEVLEQSIKRGWLGLFEVHEGTGNGNDQGVSKSAGAVHKPAGKEYRKPTILEV